MFSLKGKLIVQRACVKVFKITKIYIDLFFDDISSLNDSFSS
ncbi:hypothetical protein SAMN05660816_02887 [Niastella yeongjuensis]|nr:hypothetical protein SAMN05660816_02887 [Niastella yeongjuensis]